MTELLTRLVRLFVEERPAREELLPAAAPAPDTPARRWPTVAVLCREERAAVAAGGAALALARACGVPCGLVSGVPDAPGATVAVPAARRAAALLRRQGHGATPLGRLVSLAGPSAADDPVLSAGVDPVGALAGASAGLGRAARIAGLPGVLAVPFARSDALDRVLRWHDALVAIGEPDLEVPLAARVVASLVALGRPVAVAAPPAGQAALLARLGWQAPAPLAADLGAALAGNER